MVLIVLLSVSNVVLLFALFVYRQKGRHSTPCLHQDGLSEDSTWMVEDDRRWPTGGRGLCWHYGGIPWDQAPRPHRHHDCQPQTCELTKTLQHVDRCACGASRYGAWGAWENRGVRWRAPSSLAS